MKKHFKIFIILCLLICGWVSAWSPDGIIEFQVLPSVRVHSNMYSSISNRKYVIHIRNRGREDTDIFVHLELNENVKIERSVTVPKGGESVMNIVYPVFEKDWRGFSTSTSYVSCGDKKYDASDLALAIERSQITGDKVSYCSASLPAEDLETMYREAEFLGIGINKSNMNAEQWSSDVNDYACYNVIWISPDDEFPPAVIRTLDQWTWAGGVLVTCVMPDCRKNFPELEDSANLCKIEPYGKGKKIVLKPFKSAKETDFDKQLKNIKDDHGNQNYGYRPNRTSKSDRSKYAEILPNSVNRPDEFLDALQNAFTYKKTLNDWGRNYISISDSTLNVRLLFFVMCVFVILVGPVNYAICKKYMFVHAMLATVPLISLVFGMLLVICVAFNDGFQLRGRAIGVTYLDQNFKLASTEAYVSIWSPMNLFDDLKFDESDNVRFSGRQKEMIVCDKPGMCISRRVIPMRSTMGYYVRHVADSCSERVRVVRAENGYELVNGFSADIREFYYHDGNDRLYGISSIVKAGQRVRLEFVSNDYLKSNENSIDDSMALYNDLFESIDRNGMIAETEERGKKGFNANDTRQIYGIKEDMRKKIPKNHFLLMTDKPMFYNKGIEFSSLGQAHFVCGPVVAE